MAVIKPWSIHSKPKREQRFPLPGFGLADMVAAPPFSPTTQHTKEVELRKIVVGKQFVLCFLRNSFVNLKAIFR